MPWPEIAAGRPDSSSGPLPVSLQRRIYFSLGEQEPLTSVAAFRPVGRDTAAVVEYFKSHGVATCFQWNPGNHYAPLKPRLTKAFVWLYGK